MKVREKCCKCCVDLEKEDENVDYGTYYDDDGERRQDVMEVAFYIISINYKSLKMQQVQDCNPATQTVLTSSMTLTTWETSEERFCQFC